MNTELSGRDCLDSARRGAAWLLQQQAADGAWKPLSTPYVDAYYKASWALGLLGETVAAERSLSYTREHFLAAGGDFLPRKHPWHVDVHYLYANAYFAMGAQKLGRYEIAMPAMRFVLSQQDPASGGFYSRKTVAGQTTWTDTMSTGICGIACLAAGQLEAARRAAACLQQMVAAQPTPARFYVTTHGEQLITSFPDDQRFWRVIDTQVKDQCWYAVGLPFVLGILLHQATGEQQYADLARWFFDFQERCVNPWDGGSSGKAGWGCSMMYRITGNTHYREIALHIARNLMGWQTAEGRFDLSTVPYGSADRPTLVPSDFDASAEFTLWLGLIGANLLARDS